MSILDNIGDNLDKQHENNNFLPQKIELEDIDLGVKDFFENLDITMMDQSGRQRRVPIIWLNQELFAQRKNYWEGLVNENGEEIKRPFIAIGRKGIKQGTAPNKRTIPWMKKFGFTRPRTFDGTLMGYDKYLVRQATWVDCDYEIRLVTSYMVDVNVFYQDVLRDGFSDGQGYMSINGHQIRSILGEPSEENQISNIDDERVFQITAPLTVHGKLFDPSDYEKRTTINKVVVKMCEEGTENSGVERTFGGQSSAQPFRTSCDPVNVYTHANFLLASVPSGQDYIVSASTVLGLSGSTLAILSPGDVYTIPAGDNATVLDSTGGTLAIIAGGTSGTITDATIFNATGGTVGTVTAQGSFLAPSATVFDYSGGTLAVVAPSGLYQVSASLITWSTGGTVAQVGPGATYILSAVTALDYSGGTIASVEQGGFINVPSSSVVWSSGGTVVNLGPGGVYPLSAVTVLNHTGGTVFNDAEQGQTRNLSAAQVFDYSGGSLSNLAPSGVYNVPASTVSWSSGGTVATLGPGTNYTLSAVTIFNATGGTIFDNVEQGQVVYIPAARVFDYQGANLVNLFPNGLYTVSASTVSWSSGGTVAMLGPNENYALSAVTILNHTGGTVFNDVEQGQTRALTPSLIQDISGNTLAQLAPDGIYITSAGTGVVTVLWSSGGTADTVLVGGSYQLSAVTVLNHTGGTVFNDAEQGQTRSLSAAQVFDYSGGSLSNLAPLGVYIVPSGRTTFSNSGGILFDEVIGPGEIVSYELGDITIYNSNGVLIDTSPAGVDYNIPDIAIRNECSDLIDTLAYPQAQTYVIPSFSIENSDGSLLTGVCYSGNVYTSFSGTVTVQNSIGSFTTGYTSYGTYVLPDIDILNSTGGTVGTWPSVSAYTISDISYTNSTGGTLGFISGVYPTGGTIQVPEFTIINSDGQSGTTFAYNSEVYTNFSGGSGVASGIIYQRPVWMGQTNSYTPGDAGFHATGGTYNYPLTGNTVQRLDFASAEPFYNLVGNNFFGNSKRFTTDIGDGASDGLADFQTSSFSASTMNYIIDHLTGLGWYNIKLGYNEQWVDAVATAHAWTATSYTDFRLPSNEEVISVLNFGGGFYDSENIFKRDNTHAAGSETTLWTSNTDEVTSTLNTFYMSATNELRRRAKTSPINAATYALRTHY